MEQCVFVWCLAGDPSCKGASDLPEDCIEA